jgi:uncharacterized RDD family membrane protein YckC
MSTAGQRYRQGVATQLVTPEAVVLGFDTAGLPTRLLARLVDVVIQVVLLVGLLIGLGFLGVSGVPDVALTITVFFLGPLIMLGYPIILESLWRGRSLGKAAFGLRVVTVEGAPIRFRHALIRGAADIVDLYGLGILLVAPGIIGTISIAASKRNQRLGDIVAGTIVVRERSGATRTAPTEFSVPQGWDAYAATVDVSGLSTRDYQAVRSYLLRAGSLRAEARHHVSIDLARSIAARIRHTVPPGIHPELFLTVVAANIQARGAQRPAGPAAMAADPVAVPGGWGAVPAWPGLAPMAPDVEVPVPVAGSPGTQPVGAGGFAIPD